MPRIIVVRPAQTDPNLQGVFLGRSDNDLNQVGRIQADLLSRALDRYSLNYIAVSPLKRAIATAMPLGHDQDVTMHPVAAFQAVDMGEWEGLDREEIVCRDRARFERWLTDPSFPTPGGESLKEAYARVYPDLADIVGQTENHETLGFVVQDHVAYCIFCAALDLPLETAKRLHLDPGAFGVFERLFPDGPYRLVQWNENAHLEPALMMDRTPIHEEVEPV